MSSLAACGGKDGGATTTATAPAATPATQPVPTATATVPTATTGEPQQGGGGDEEPARVPAVFTVIGGALAPKRIIVPAFLTIEVRVTAVRAPATVTIQVPGRTRTLQVGAGATAVQRLKGLHPGDYPLRTTGGGSAVLHVVSGGAPGP